MLKSKEDLVPCSMHGELLKGYFKVPGKPFSVNKNGVVFSHLDEKIVTTTLCVRNTYTTAGRYFVHNLMAETFLVKPDNIVNTPLVVNHKNGVKGDNNIENLEWVTRSGNAIHAYETGLRPDNIPLKCKNVETGEVLRFYSNGEAARKFGTNTSRIHGYLHRRIKPVLFLERYVMVLENESFPSEQEYSSWRKSIINADIAAIDNLTGKITLFTTLQHLADYFNISYGMVHRVVSRARRNNELTSHYKNFTFQPVDFLKDYLETKAEDKRVSHSDRFSSYKPPGSKPKRVSVTNIQTNEVKQYESLLDFSEEIGEKKNTVQKYILYHNDMWKDLYKIEYLD